ncbi:hypothetical protein ACLOJK_003761, partial [Asimina triloba]
QAMHCSCDGVFNADDVGRRCGLLWERHAVADIADVLNGEQLAASDGGMGDVKAGLASGVVRCSWPMDVCAATTGGGIVGVVDGDGRDGQHG